MRYEIGDLPLRALLPAIARAEDQLARLDEIVRRSSVRQGFTERSHFIEATASMWVAGELVHIEDLVLHDADKDVRTPTHEITMAHSILRTRRRITSAEADWAISSGGIASLTARSPDPTGEEQREEGLAVSETAQDVGYDYFAAELAEIDAVIDRSSRALEAAKKASGAVAVGELIIRDPEWDQGGRLSNWKTISQEVASLPATLGAAVLWDAWESLEPLERQHWLGAQLVNSFLRSRGKVSSHLFGLNVGLKAVPRERRRSRERVVRLLAALDGMALGSELAMKDIIRLGQARDQLERKLKGKRSSSSLPRLVELLIACPIISSSMITKDLKVSHRGALNLVAELGVREVTGRRSFRAWGLI